LRDHRLRLMVAVSACAFLIVIGRAVQVQVLDAASLAARAVQQQQTVITIPGLRGTIYSSDGQVLAEEMPAVSIVANQRLVKHPGQEAKVIAGDLGYQLVKVPKIKEKKKKKPTKAQLKFIEHQTRRRAAFKLEVQSLTAALTGTSTFAYVARQLDPPVARRILAHHLPGLSGVGEDRRAYPNGSLAAQLIGFTDIDSSGVNGSGLEHMLNPYLRAREGKRVIVRDPSGMALETVQLSAPGNGRNVRLTIDSNVEAYVQQVLAQTVRSTGARSATAIVMNPHTGAILAMASAPTYDNNKVHNLSASQYGYTQNLATDMAYEPGSVFKAVTYSAALSEGLIYPGMEFKNLPYSLHVADKVIHDDAPRPPENFTARKCLAVSSNVCADTIASWVHQGPLLQWIYRFGFGRYPSLRFPGDTPGIVPPLNQWSGSSIGTIPIGQGISVTPLQIADMYAAIANGGVMPEPHVIKGIQGVHLPRPRGRRVLRPAVDATLVSMLKNVVDWQSGTGVAARIPGYSVAGKTGTAQMANGHGGYAKGQYMASFVGFFPASAPRVLIMVAVQRPRTSIFGGTVAAPAFEQIGAWYAKHAGIPQDQPQH
jgi:cell division protein FtsI/penicillin-binding protein 2